MYSDVTEYVQDLPTDAFNTISKDKAVWQYVEYASRLKSWSKFRRCFFTRLHRDEAGQYVMGFGKPDSIIYTNIGNCPKADQRLWAAGWSEWFDAETINRKSHQRLTS